MKDFFPVFFGLKGRFLSAQAEGLGMASAAFPALKGPFKVASGYYGERPLQGQITILPNTPGLRPGLTESALQAEKSFTALPGGAIVNSPGGVPWGRDRIR